MARGEQAVRREAVSRRLAGESPEAIARSLGRTRQWVARWVHRYDPADPEWATAHSRAPRTVANRTPAELEAQVLAVRGRLEADPWAQVGAEAIAWELRELDLDAPSTRTIERILARAGKVRRRRRERYEPKGVPYPAPPAEAPGDLWQADIVGPRHQRFRSREHVAERALAFERFHNANHRYRAIGRRTPDELTAAAKRRAAIPRAELPAGWPEQGRVEFIRFIRSDQQLRILRRQITMPEHLTYRHVTATLDLAIPSQQGNLLVCDHEGELVQRASIVTPSRSR